MQGYSYDRDTGEYKGVVELTEVLGVLIVPAFTTLTPVIDPEIDNIRIWDGTVWKYQRVGTDNEPTDERQGPTKADVDIERDRRIAAGMSFNIDGTFIPLQGDLASQINLMALKDQATALKDAGIETYSIVFRDAVNDMHYLNADGMISLVNQGFTWVSGIYQKSWALKDQPFVPDDYYDNKYWS